MTRRALVVLWLLGASWAVPGCTPSQWADAVSVAKPFVKFSCELAQILCAKDDDVACGIISAACGVAPALLGETSGGEEEAHDLDAEPEPK